MVAGRGGEGLEGRGRASWLRHDGWHVGSAVDCSCAANVFHDREAAVVDFVVRLLLAYGEREYGDLFAVDGLPAQPGHLAFGSVEKNYTEDEACAALRDLPVLASGVFLLDGRWRQLYAVLALYGGGVRAQQEEILIDRVRSAEGL